MKTVTLFLFLLFIPFFSFSQVLPYPIIFIHGLNSNSKVWDVQGNYLISQGLKSGGRIDFSLNADGNNSTTNKLIFENGADISSLTFPQDLKVGDFYVLNFDINNSGELFPSDDSIPFNDVLSNESAIAKQGVALQYAIKTVLLITKKDKVILMGHSMGGLCAREYLQNPEIWQSDGEHHVAKLVTTGTPHGGYTGLGLSPSIDFQSEAYRDLKKSYTISEQDGVYLFGGLENNSVMNNNLLYNFYNVDVNCNGIINENIVGLNEKPRFYDVDYAYIIGYCTGCPTQGGYSGDGVVRADNANFSNFYPIPEPKNEFSYIGFASIETHSDLPEQVYQNMQGLDEPNEYNLAYEIKEDNVYQGFITEQPVNGYDQDFDDFKFTITDEKQCDFYVINNYSGELVARIMDSEFNYITGIIISGNDLEILSQTLSSGQYYFEIFATASTESYKTPYLFEMTTSTLSVNNFNQNNTILYPNPTDSKVFINSDSTFENIEIYNLLGQKVKHINDYKNGIDVSDLRNGTYVLKLYNNEIFEIKKFIKK